MGIPNKPVSEQWHDAGLAWVDAENAAQLLEETKSAVLSQYIAEEIAADPKMSIAKAETMVRSSPKWREFVERMVKARTAANRARINRDYLRMKFSEWVAEDANHRAGTRL
jgi:hypothetical protein